MYTREVLPQIASPVENGIPVIGTWNRAFEKVDLLEIKNPYGFPQPKWARGYRIKEWQSFSAHNDSYYLEAVFCNVKLYRMAQLILFDKEKNHKYIFKKVKPGSGWQLPVSLANSSVNNHSLSFFFRIHCWLDADTIKLDIDIEASRREPSLTAHLAYNINRQDVTPIAVSLGFSKQRIMYAFKTFAPIQGDIVLAGKHISIKQDNCFGVFCDYKGFFPRIMQTTICSAAGFNEENRRFGFHIAENQTREKNKNNENALWIDGKITLLPPVHITMPNGPDADWIIQDVEGMVDLTFTPKELSKSGVKLIITRAEFHSPLGYFNGVFINCDGEKINVKNFLGTGETLYLRV